MFRYPENVLLKVSSCHGNIGSRYEKIPYEEITMGLYDDFELAKKMIEKMILNGAMMRFLDDEALSFKELINSDFEPVQYRISAYEKNSIGSTINNIVVYEVSIPEVSNAEKGIQFKGPACIAEEYSFYLDNLKSKEHYLNQALAKKPMDEEEIARRRKLYENAKEAVEFIDYMIEPDVITDTLNNYQDNIDCLTSDYLVRFETELAQYVPEYYEHMRRCIAANNKQEQSI